MSATKKPRAYERAPVEVTVDFESEHNFFTGITSDISEGGVFVATYVAPPIGEVLDIVLGLPGQGELMRLRGVVRWIREATSQRDGLPPGFGIQWIWLPLDAQVAIARFTAQRDSIYYEAA